MTFLSQTYKLTYLNETSSLYLSCQTKCPLPLFKANPSTNTLYPSLLVTYRTQIPPSNFWSLYCIFNLSLSRPSPESMTRHKSHPLFKIFYFITFRILILRRQRQSGQLGDERHNFEISINTTTTTTPKKAQSN